MFNVNVQDPESGGMMAFDFGSQQHMAGGDFSDHKSNCQICSSPNYPLGRDLPPNTSNFDVLQNPNSVSNYGKFHLPLWIQRKLFYSRDGENRGKFLTRDECNEL